MDKVDISNLAEDFTKYLTDNGVTDIIIKDDVWYGLKRFMFTCAIVTGYVGDETSYNDRWCYKDEITALVCLLGWKEDGFNGEPVGWHRHPSTGRRRENGDAYTEYVNP